MFPVTEIHWEKHLLAEHLQSGLPSPTRAPSRALAVTSVCAVRARHGQASVRLGWRAAEGDVDVVSSAVTTETGRLEDTCGGAQFSCLTSAAMAAISLGRGCVYRQWTWDWLGVVGVVGVQPVAASTSSDLPAYHKCLPPPRVPLSHTGGGLKAHFWREASKPVTDVFLNWGKTITEGEPE